MHRPSRKYVSVVVSVALAMGVSSLAIGALISAPSSATSIDRTVRIAAEQDSFMSSLNPRMNRSDFGRLVARETPGVRKVSYLKFTFPSSNLGNDEVVGAKLLLEPLNSQSVPVEVRLVENNSWSATKVTYSNAPRVGGVIGRLTPGPATTRWVDVSNVVTEPGTYSFALTTDDGVARFASTETRSAPTLIVRIKKKSVSASPSQSTSPEPNPSPTEEPKPAETATTAPAPAPSQSESGSPTPSTEPSPSAGDDGKCVELFPGDPCGGTMYYGASVEGGDPRTLETELSQGLTLFRSYMNSSTSASKFASRASTDVAAGRVPLISTKVPGSWGDVANGTYDTWLLDRIKALAAVDGPVWLTLHHEPRGDGDPADWVRMQQHARMLIDAHSTNIALVGILNGWDFLEKNGTPERWRMPVGTGVHVMGFDSYNPWSPTNGVDWKAADKAFSPGVTIQGWGYPTLVGEHGVRTDPDNPGRSAQWLKDAYDYALSHGFVGMSYFDSGANSPDGTWDLTGERLEQFGRNLSRGETAHLAR